MRSIKGEIMRRKRNYKKTTDNNETVVLPIREIVGYKIAGPHCGRDRKGKFHCKCGNCKPILFKVSQKSNSSCNNTCNSSND